MPEKVYALTVGSSWLLHVVMDSSMVDSCISCQSSGYSVWETAGGTKETISCPNTASLHLNEEQPLQAHILTHSPLATKVNLQICHPNP